MEDNKKKKTSGKNFKKISLKVLKIMLIGSLLLGFLGGGLALGMVAASLQNVPELNRDLLENPSLPTKVVDRNGDFIGEARDTNRVWVDYEDMPRDLVNAFIATEDNKFYDHPGFDMRGLGRAALSNVQNDTISGGSTITQQTAKQIFLHQGKSMERKIQELYLALQIEKLYTKPEIMEFYLNSAVHYGHNEHGVGAASRSLYNKSLDELTLGEMALLAGIPNWPVRYDPRVGTMEAAYERRNHVLSRMYRFEYITEEQYEEAKNEEIILASNQGDDNDRNERYRSIVHVGPYNYALQASEDILMELYEYDRQEARNAIRNHGYTITTTIDLEKQIIAENVINDDRHYRTPYSGPGKQEEASATLIDVKTGEIMALVTGRKADPVNNAVLRPVNSLRQPGSAIKPIVSYAPAIENKTLFPGSVIDDAPVIYPGGNKPYTPENYGRTFNGLVTVRQSLTWSYNVPAVKALESVGLNSGANFAHNLGLSQYTSLDGLAAAVGSKDTTALELTSAFSAFGNNGVLAESYFIKEIVDRNGNVIYTAQPQSKVVMSEETAFLVTDMLKDVITSGTGARTRNHFTKTAAGKTGTTNDGRDVWMVGYTPHYALSVWVGWDTENRNVEGNQHREMWGKIMHGVHQDLPNTPFSQPRNIVQVPVSTKSGKLPSPLTPSQYIKSDYFIRGYEPTDVCDAFVEVTICKKTGLLASDSCPPHHRKTKVMLAPREYITTTSEWTAGAGRIPADVKDMAPTETCDMHDGSGSSTPSGLTTSPTSNGIRLNWNAASDLKGYNIYRKSGNDDFQLLNSTPIKATEFLDTTAKKDVEYQYYVTGITRDGSETRPSNTVTATMSSAVQRVPDFNLTIRNNRVEINWEPALNASQYRIFRSTQEGSGFTEIERTRRTTHVDRNVEPNNTYYYYIVAEGADPSPTKSITLSNGNGNGNGNGNDDDNEGTDDSDEDSSESDNGN